MHLRAHPDWHDVVAANWKRTTGFLLAFREPCITIRDDEIASIRKNRVLVDLDASSLASWRPPASWMLAVILCSDDDVAPVVDWVGRWKAEPARIHFYAHADTDPFQVLRPWADAGLPPPRVEEGVSSWRHLHKRFSLDLSIRILQDWG